MWRWLLTSNYISNWSMKMGRRKGKHLRSSKTNLQRHVSTQFRNFSLTPTSKNSPLHMRVLQAPPKASDSSKKGTNKKARSCDSAMRKKLLKLKETVLQYTSCDASWHLVISAIRKRRMLLRVWLVTGGEETRRRIRRNISSGKCDPFRDPHAFGNGRVSPIPPLPDHKPGILRRNFQR